jgi:uncharacterized protein (DUF2141 family)
MKKIALSILILAFFASISYAKNGTVTVKITGIEKIKGHILIGLFNKAKGYPDIGKEYKGITIKVTKKSISHTFVDVPPGDYAIAVVHDINKNGAVDYNFIGMPLEMYAFSGNSGCIGKPPFNKAKFKLNGKYTIKLKLK